MATDASAAKSACQHTPHFGHARERALAILDGKAAIDPEFQRRAAKHIVDIATLFESFDCLYPIENPRSSALNTIWRKADFTFHPFEYGGCLPRRDVHPLYPRAMPPRDAYTKGTGLWTSQGCVMP
jgi:hypothetical protein